MRAEQIESVALPHAQYSSCAPWPCKFGSWPLIWRMHTVYSHTNSTTPQLVPALCIWRPGLSVRDASILSFRNPTDLHKVHAGSVGPNASQWYADRPTTGWSLPQLRNSQSRPPQLLYVMYWSRVSQLWQKMSHTQPNSSVLGLNVYSCHMLASPTPWWV